MLGEEGGSERGECVGRVRIGEATSDEEAILGGDRTDMTEGSNIGDGT